jgi:hypothetical protein
LLLLAIIGFFAWRAGKRELKTTTKKDMALSNKIN